MKNVGAWCCRESSWEGHMLRILAAHVSFSPLAHLVMLIPEDETHCHLLLPTEAGMLSYQSMMLEWKCLVYILCFYPPRPCSHQPTPALLSHHSSYSVAGLRIFKSL